VKVESVPIATLSQDPANARKHDDKNLEAIKASLRRFGQQKPIVVDSSNVVRAGNGTLAAAIALGWDSINVVQTDLQGSEATAYAIADNRTAELAEWDESVLAASLSSLADVDETWLSDLQFSEKELAELVASTQEQEIIEDEVPDLTTDPVTQTGDLWILGEHRLLCGDSTNKKDVSRLMNGAKADLCFTSPPYGQQRDYTSESQDKCSDWFNLMCGVFSNLPMSQNAQVLVNLGLIHRNNEYVAYWDDWLEWMKQIEYRRFGWYVWDQGAGLPGDWNGRLAPSFEFIWHFNKHSRKPLKWIETKPESRAAKGKGGTVGFRKEGGSVPVTSPDKIGQNFKIPDSVIRINRNSQDGKLHPATFPVALPSFAINTWEGDLFEPFCGSGTTLIAAEQLDRKCYGMEISRQYCDVIVERWEKLTGKKARLEGDGSTS